VTPGTELPVEGLFSPEPVGGRLEHWMAQVAQIGTGSREGGFFLMIGRK
jgi:hypothetical protein